MVHKLRSKAHRGQIGLVSANGGVLTEQSAGIYSTQPCPYKPYRRRDPDEYGTIPALPMSRFCNEHAAPTVATVLSWTIEYSRSPNIPVTGFIIAETKADRKRFVAKTKPRDTRTIHWMLRVQDD